MSKNSNDNNDASLFTEEELLIRKSNMERRELMLKELFEDGSPKQSGDMRVAKEIIETADNAILTTAKLRKDAEKQKDDSEVTSLILAAIMSSAKNNQSGRNSGPVTIDETFIPNDIVDGELVDGVHQLEMIDFIDDDE